MRATTRVSKEQAEENEVGALSVIQAGGPAWIRTKNQQIMSPSTGSENKDTTSLPSAESGKVLQNPQPPRNQEQQVPPTKSAKTAKPSTTSATKDRKSV